MNHFVKNSLLAALAAGTALSLRADITVDAARPAGTITRMLNGVSQGGNALSYTKPAMLAGLRELPVGTVRIEMVTGSDRYRLYDPATGKFDFSRLDEEIENVRKAGATPLINLFGTPRHLASDPGAKVPIFTPPRDGQAYADFCAAIVRHVNIEKGYGVKYWEFWNEPSGSHFWTTWRQDKNDFFRLYELTARAVKTVDPQALIGGFGDNAQYLSHYEDFLKYLKKHPAPLDFFTVHYYGDWAGRNGKPDPAAYRIFNDKLKLLSRRYLGRELPVFYSEWNLPAESVGRSTPARIAAWIGASLTEMQNSANIIGAHFFRVEHYKDPYSSLLDHQGRPRLAWRELKYFSLLPENRVEAVSGDSATRVLAAKDDEALVIFINRYADSAENTTLRIRGLAPDSACRAEFFAESGDAAARTGMPVATIRECRSGGDGEIAIPLKLDPFHSLLIRLRR